MDHLGTKRIETHRLILRPFVQEDAQAMYENWCSDPEVTKYLTWPAYTSVDTAHEILDIWIKEYENKNFYQWAIELKELGQPIGSISVVEQKEKAKVAHIVYCLGRNWWRQGSGTSLVAGLFSRTATFLPVRRSFGRSWPDSVILRSSLG